MYGCVSSFTIFQFIDYCANLSSSTFAYIHTRRIRVTKVIVKTRNLVNLKLAYLIISIIEIICKGYKILVKLICNISTVCYFFIINNEYWLKLTMLFAPNSVNQFSCFYTVTLVFHQLIKVIL